jgi:hypothetical protein
MILLDILLTACITMALLWGEHYTPWHLFLGRELPRPAAYTLGTLAIIIPVSGLYILWSMGGPELDNCLLHAAAALWVDVALGGLTVYVLYALDSLKQINTELDMARREVRVWRDQDEQPTRSATGTIGEQPGTISQGQKIGGGTQDQDELYPHS